MLFLAFSFLHNYLCNLKKNWKQQESYNLRVLLQLQAKQNVGEKILFMIFVSTFLAAHP